MKITEIIVTAGRTFSDPHESYSNHRPSVTLKATVGDGENIEDAVRLLQQKASEMVEEHRAAILFDSDYNYQQEMQKYQGGVPF